MKTILLISKNYEDAVVSLIRYKLEMLDSGYILSLYGENKEVF